MKLKEINLIKTTALVEPKMESIYVGKTCSPCATLVVTKYDSASECWQIIKRFNVPEGDNKPALKKEKWPGPLGGSVG